MRWNMIKILVDAMHQEIFKTKEQTSFNDEEKSFYIYKYLVENIKYDYKLLKDREQNALTKEIRNKKAVNNYDEIMNVFTNKKGICSSISQVYKLLLEKSNIESKAIICNDGNLVKHQLNLVKRNNAWTFDDVTRGIIYKNEGLENFNYNYERCPIINQTILGVLPEDYYDAVLGREEKRMPEPFNEFSLYNLPLGVINKEKSNNNFSK